MTRWYPVPPGENYTRGWAIYDSKGTLIISHFGEMDEPTANHVAELHNQYAVPEQSGDEMQENEPLKPGDRVLIKKPDFDELPGWTPGMDVLDGAYDYVQYVMTGGEVVLNDTEYIFNARWLTKV